MSREYDFSLVLEGIADLSEQFADAMFEAGCDDATFSLRYGRIHASFSREANSLKDAILSALEDVSNAGVGAIVMRVDTCNLVTQAEIGRRIERTRQQIHQYSTGTRGPGGFPPPACEISEGNPVWYWCEVADWLLRNQMINEEVALAADVVEMINAALEYTHMQHRRPELATEIIRSMSLNM